MVRVPMIGCRWPPEPSTKLAEVRDLDLDLERHLLVVVDARLDVDRMPTSWYWNEVIGTMLPPTVLEVLKVVSGIGTWSPITRLRLLALGDAQLRLGQELGVAVLS